MPYGVSPTPDELLQAWSGPNEAAEKCLKLPGPNIFIPDDFSLVCDTEAEASSTLQGDATKAGEGRALAQEDGRGEREKKYGGRGGGGDLLYVGPYMPLFVRFGLIFFVGCRFVTLSV